MVGQRVIERPFRQCPESRVPATQREHPGILELLLTPRVRQRLRVGPDRAGMALHGGMDIEQGAVGVEDNGAGADQDISRGHHGLLEEWD